MPILPFPITLPPLTRKGGDSTSTATTYPITLLERKCLEANRNVVRLQQKLKATIEPGEARDAIVWELKWACLELTIARWNLEIGFTL